ncbi:MAG: hypothetical protein QM496_01465 [Verrucomicrobiota bacterium]
MDTFVVLQIGQITMLAMVAALVFNALCKRFWLAALFAVVGAGGVYTLGCIIYMEVIIPEGLSYWANLSYRGILRMLVLGFVVAVVPALLVICGLRKIRFEQF